MSGRKIDRRALASEAAEGQGRALAALAAAGPVGHAVVDLGVLVLQRRRERRR